MSGLAWCVYVSLGLLAILDVARIAAASGLHGVMTGGGDVVGSYHDYARWTGYYGLLVLLSAGVFIAWFFQAYKNLRRLGVANLRFGNGWAIGAWFVPILGMWRPKQIANDVWRGSERGAELTGGWRTVPVPSLLHWWWGLFIVQGLLIYVGQRTTAAGYAKLGFFGQLNDGFSQIKTGTTLDIIGGVLGLAAVALAVRVVAQITERLDQIREEAPQAAYPPQAAQYAHAPQYAQAPQYPPAPPAPQYAQAPPVPQHQANAFQPQYAHSQPPPSPPVAAPPPVAPQPPPTEQRIQCPDCAEWIQAEANVCRFCGHRLRPLGQ
ncbi:MAG TPA: DUF4328 domain-containing protein [Solirubrobacterales bacterium]|nr:DUF4328 domain-containing protein [Solirubrobacterales bacterium]